MSPFPRFARFSRFASLSLGLLLLAACGPAEDTRPGQPVTHRRQAFKAILKTFEPMGMQLRENRYDPQAFLQLAETLEQQKAAPWRYFGADTNYPPTRAKAAVWSEAARFARERDEFLAAVAELQQAAASRDETKVRPAYDRVHDSCRSCHKAFKDN